ncbi:MAG: hypothetical protein ACMZ64_10585 [Oleiphilus sp.]
MPPMLKKDTLSDPSKVNDTEATLKLGLKFLLRRYLENQHEAIAQRIVQQLETILRHDDCIGFPNERCHYHRLLHNWRAQCLRLKPAKT